jgi:hypothetical protein
MLTVHWHVSNVPEAEVEDAITENAPDGKATRTALFNSILIIVRRAISIDRFGGCPLINAGTPAAVCRIYSAG